MARGQWWPVVQWTGLEGPPSHHRGRRAALPAGLRGATNLPPGGPMLQARQKAQAAAAGLVISMNVMAAVRHASGRGERAGRLAGASAGTSAALCCYYYCDDCICTCVSPAASPSRWMRPWQIPFVLLVEPCNAGRRSLLCACACITRVHVCACVTCVSELRSAGIGWADEARHSRHVLHDASS